MMVKSKASIKPKSAVKPNKKISSKQNNLSQLSEDIISNISVGIYIVQNGKFVYVSPIFQKLSGYSYTDLAGTNPLDYLHPDDREVVRKIVIKNLKGKSTASYEYRFIRKNKEIVWILEMISSITYKGKRAALVSFMDITERKEADEALRRSEEKYRSIIEDIQEGYFENDLAGNFTFVNDALCRLIGYSREEVIGKNNRQYTDEKTAKKTYQAYNRIYRTGEPTKGIEIEYIRKDGIKGFAEFSVSLMRDAESKPIGFRGISHDITERKQAEEALRQNEEKYRTMIETIQDGYSETDLTGKYSYINDVICQRLNRSREELIGMSYRQFQNETNSKKTYQAFHKLYMTGEPIKALEMEIIRPDGTKGISEMSVSLMRNAQGQPIGFHNISRDVTERKRMEDELRQSEERYRTILESTDNGYCEQDLAGNFTFLNDSMCQIYGYPKEELMGMNYKQYTDKESGEKCFQAYSNIYRTGEPGKVFDFEIIRKDGTRRHIESSVSLKKDSAGKPIAFRGIVRDVTERKLAEAALQKSEEKYRNILESIQEGYFELDLAGNYTFVNDANCRFLGYTKEELVGMSSRKHMDKETAKKIYQPYRELYLTGKPIETLEVESIRKDGTKVIYETSVSLIRDSKGKPIGYRGVSRDITERKLLEEKIRQSEERYRTIIEETEEWYCETDLAGNILFFNDAIARALGYPPKELTGLNFRALFKQEQTEEIYKIFHQVYEIGEPVKNLPQEFVRPDGSITFAEFSIFPKRDHRGKIFGFRGVGHDINERKRVEQELSYMATHDPLTGLPNRMLFMDRLKMALAHAKRNKQKLAVMMLDLDHFKDINDTLGHMVGDRLLKEIGLRLTGLLRQNDTISRLGGDEFIILLPEIVRMEDSAEVAEKILKAIQQPFIYDSHKLITSTSIGIAIYPDDCQDMDSLMKNADMAMYSVKAHGRKSYQFFTKTNL